MTITSIPDILTDSRIPQSELQRFLLESTPNSTNAFQLVNSLEYTVLTRIKSELKRQGAFYTPPALVNLILDEMEFGASKPDHALRLLDLSCGTGRFLSEGLRRIFHYHQKQGKTPEQCAHFAAQSVSGVEIDPTTRNIARLQMLAVLHQLVGISGERGVVFPNIPISTGDCLLGGSPLPEINQNAWDFIVLNPPYVTQKGEKNAPKIGPRYAKDLKNRYQTLNPQVYKKEWGLDIPGHLKLNLLVPFIEYAICLLAPQGRLGVIVHKNLLDVGSYWPLRHFILRNCQIRKILDLSTSGFPEVTGETVILILEKKGPDEKEPTKIEITPRLTRNPPGYCQSEGKTQIYQERFLTTFQESFLIYPQEEHYSIKDKIWQASSVAKLGTLAEISSFGLNLPASSESTYLKHPDWVPAVRGRDIGRFRIIRPDRVVDYDPKVLSRSGQAALFAAPLKVIMQRIGPRLQACLDMEQRACFNSTNMIIPHSPEVNFSKYLLAVLNSSLMDAYYKLFLSNQNIMTVNVTQAKLAELPIILPPKSKLDQIVQMIDTILERTDAPGNIQVKMDVIDQTVVEIYNLQPKEYSTLRSF